MVGSALRIADIDRCHRSRGWKCCGYHYVIPVDGSIERGRPDEMVGAHSWNHNRHPKGVAYVGELPGDGSRPDDTMAGAQ